MHPPEAEKTGLSGVTPKTQDDLFNLERQIVSQHGGFQMHYLGHDDT